MNNKIKNLLTNQYEWIKKDLLFLLSLNLLAWFIFTYFQLNVYFKAIFLFVLGLKNAYFASLGAIMPTPGASIGSFSWKYIQSLSFNRKDLILALCLSRLLNTLPLILWCFSMCVLYNKVFFTPAATMNEFLRMFASGIIAIFISGSISLTAIISFPRLQFQKKNTSESFYQGIKYTLLFFLAALYSFIFCFYLANKGIQVSHYFGKMWSVFEYIIDTWWLPVALMLVSLLVTRGTLRKWINEKKSYSKVDWKPKRDIPIVFISIILIIIPFKRVDWETPYLYTGHDIFKAINQNDLTRLTGFLSDKEAINFKNKFGVTPLLAAANENNFSFYKKLEAAGAVYKGETITRKKVDETGMDALTLAIKTDDPEFVEHLLKQKLDPNLKLINFIGSPLHFAAVNCKTRILDLLIKYGGNINLRNETMMTPLHAAVSGNCFGVVVALVESGANLTEKDADGKMAVDNAKDEIAYYLKRHLETSSSP